MIKTLLLATTCVIGSGAGALQKNAPVLNHHYAITQETGQIYNQTEITSENTTNQTSTIDTGYKMPSPYSGNAYINLNYGRTRQENNNYLISDTIVADAYQSYNGIEDNTGDMMNNLGIQDWENVTPYYEYWQIIKYTPYTTNSAVNFIINLNPNVYVVYGQEIYDIDDEDTLIFESYYKYNIYFYQTTENIDTLMGFNNLNQFQYNPFADINKTLLAYETINNASISHNDPNIQASKNRTLPPGNTFDMWEFDYETAVTTTGTIYFLTHLTIETDYMDKDQNGDDADGYPGGFNTNVYNTDIIRSIKTTPTGDTYDYEIVDIGGLMFDILTMPFAFVSQAFNLTLFPNTPYSINISSLFLAIFAALTFIFIIKKFIKK